MILRRLFPRRTLSEVALADKIDTARALLERGQLDAAMSICRDLLVAGPDRQESICLAGEISAKKGDTYEALAAYSRAIQLNSTNPLPYYKRANLLRDCGRFEESLADYSKAIALDPNYARAYCNRGVVLQHLHRPEEARQSYDRAIELDPSDAFALFNRAAVLRELNQLVEALKSYELAIAAKPEYAECYCNLGLLQADLGKFESALASYDRCIEINPRLSTAHFNRGVLLQGQKRWAQALASYSRAIDIDERYADAFSNRGVVYLELAQWNAAWTSLNQAISLRPNFPEAYFNLGNLLLQKGQLREAVECYDKAIELKPDYADALYNRADTLLQAQQWSAAVEGFNSLSRADPDRQYLKGMRLYARMYLCDWSGLDAEISALIQALNADAKASPPFPVLTLTDRPELQLKCAQSWVQCASAIDGAPDAFMPREASTRIRVGYFSGDFRTHPVSMLMAGVIENHDRSKFESVAFAYGPDVQDDVRRRLEKAFDRFIDVRELSDQQVAQMARRMGIDIAVDLAGYTGNGRTKIFAWRAAPLQLNFLGYPGTMGADFIDYMIGDNAVIPVDERKQYAEKIINLPAGFMPTDSARAIAERPFTREEFGLPVDGFVYCCFNNSYKLTPEVFDSWMSLLRRLPGSVLWLSRHNETASRNILQEAVQRGIEASRVVFAERMSSHAEHLARHRLADLFLDTYPYNAHATAADALWVGLPVVTRAGRGFAARVAASLLTASGLQELITSSPREYEDVAFDLASNPDRLAKLKATLLRNRRDGNWFDTNAYTRNLEAAYACIYNRHAAGLPPEHIQIAPQA